MIADDMKEQLRQLDDECLIAIIGYCEGLLDCRPDESGEAKSIKIKVQGGCVLDVEDLPVSCSVFWIQPEFSFIKPFRKLKETEGVIKR